MIRRRSHPHAGRRSFGIRQGFTLIELMIAMIVFTIGVLAMMSSAGSVMTMMGGSQRRTVAATVAEARFERLRAQSCSQHTNGTLVTQGVRETWQIVPLTLADDVTVVVTYPAAGGRIATQTYRTFVPC